MRNCRRELQDPTVSSLQTNLSLLSQSRGDPLNALKNLKPSSRWINLSTAPCCFSTPALSAVVFDLHFLKSIWDFPKRIFIWSFFVLKKMFSHTWQLFSLIFSIQTYPTGVSLLSFSGRPWPKNIHGYAISWENLSLNTLSSLLPSAGARLRIYCRSLLSSTKSVDVNMVSVTPTRDLH